MNSTTANTAAGSGLTVQQPLTRATTLATLMRREFWEHPALWRAPAIVAALLGISTLFSMTINVDGGHVPHLQDPDRIAVLNITQDVWAGLIYLVASIVVTFYVLDALYAERKDRSILFWKSLPVSDAQTVGAKLLTGLVVVPLGSWLLALLSFLVFFAIWSVRQHLGYAPDIAHWDTLAWVRLEGATLLALVLAILWYAPLAVLLMLVSVLVRRSPMMWLTLAVIAGLVAERILLGTHYLWRLISYRSNGLWHLLTSGHETVAIDKHNLLPIDRWLLQLNFGGTLSSPDLWLGVAAAVVLFLVTVRIRRYRDDT